MLVDTVVVEAGGVVVGGSAVDELIPLVVEGFDGVVDGVEVLLLLIDVEVKAVTMICPIE